MFSNTYTALSTLFGLTLTADHQHRCHHYDVEVTEEKVRAVMAAHPTRFEWQNPDSVHCHNENGCLYLVIKLDVPAEELQDGEAPQLYDELFCFDTTDKTLHVV